MNFHQGAGLVENRDGAGNADIDAKDRRPARGLGGGVKRGVGPFQFTLPGRRGDALEKRRALMTEWAAFISTLPAKEQK
jgi:hypothetical protein